MTFTGYYLKWWLSVLHIRWFVDTWFFTHSRDKRAVTRLENVRQLNIRQGKKLCFQLSHTQPLIANYKRIRLTRWVTSKLLIKTPERLQLTLPLCLHYQLLTDYFINKYAHLKQRLQYKSSSQSWHLTIASPLHIQHQGSSSLSSSSWSDFLEGFDPGTLGYWKKT